MHLVRLKLNGTDLKVIVSWKEPDWGDVAPKPSAQALIGMMTFLKSVTFVLSCCLT